MLLLLFQPLALWYDHESFISLFPSCLRSLLLLELQWIKQDYTDLILLNSAN